MASHNVSSSPVLTRYQGLHRNLQPFSVLVHNPDVLQENYDHVCVKDKHYLLPDLLMTDLIMKCLEKQVLSYINSCIPTTPPTWTYYSFHIFTTDHCSGTPGVEEHLHKDTV